MKRISMSRSSRKRPSWLAALATVAILLPVSSGRGDIILSGDTNIAAAVNGSFGPFPNDNDTFFANVLGDRTTVRIFEQGVNSPILDMFYNSLPGVSSSVLSGTVTPTALSGVDLFIVELPQRSFLAPEIAALRSFSDSGGTLFFIGEHGLFDPAADARINANLAALGSNLRLTVSIDDGGANIATVANGQIMANPLTSGVNSFVYGGQAVSAVTGGQPLFLQRDRQTAFVAIEVNVIPEPSSLVMMSIGILSAIAHRLRVGCSCREKGTEKGDILLF